MSLFKPKNNTNERKTRIIPPIPAEVKKNETKTSDYHEFKIKTNLTDPNSPTYIKLIPYFENGTPEEFLKFEADWLDLYKLWRIITGPTYFAVITSLLKGKALAEFELHTNQPPETIQNGKNRILKPSGYQPKTLYASFLPKALWNVNQGYHCQNRKIELLLAEISAPDPSRWYNRTRSNETGD